MKHPAALLLALPLGLLAPLAPAQVPAAPPAAESAVSAAARAAIAERGQALLGTLIEAGLPGASAALILPDGSELLLTAGHADREAGRAMRPSDRLLSGSIGKTYVAAVVLDLVRAGELDLERTAASYFEGSSFESQELEWLERVPNAGEVTLRQLLRHQSGFPRYAFQGEFGRDLVAEPDRVWRPEELLSYVFDQPALFEPGQGWAYSDTNYIVVGMVIERVSGQPFYACARERLLEPHGLVDSLPSDSREIPGLTQGYVVLGRQLGVPERLLVDGRCVINPQFEWCGGGWANTPADLARWARSLYSGRALERPYLEELLDAVAAPELGPGVRYGLAAMLRETGAGPCVYHDGFMPGFLSSMGWFPEAEVAVALQLNSDDLRTLGRPPSEICVELVQAVRSILAG